MALKLQKIVNPSPVYQHMVDYNVLSGGWTIGRISEEVDGPPAYKWSWAFQMSGPIGKTFDRAATLEEAKEQLRGAWERWKAWAELEEVGAL